MKKILSISIVIILLLAITCQADSTKQAIPSAQYKYVGSVNSNKYHRLSCKWAKKIKPKNAVYFKDKKEAEEKGYKPCKVCKP